MNRPTLRAHQQARQEALAAILGGHARAADGARAGQAGPPRLLAAEPPAGGARPAGAGRAYRAYPAGAPVQALQAGSPPAGDFTAGLLQQAPDFSRLAVHGHRIVRRGIPARALDAVSRYLGLPKSALAESIDLDRSTASRLAAKDQPLPAHAAEALLRLLELHDLAGEVFASEEDAAGWLRTAHPLLDGESPLQAARTSFGAQDARNMLLALQYGGVV